MTKVELASYLASLITILNDFDDNGKNRPQWLGAEYTRVYETFKSSIDKENKS